MPKLETHLFKKGAVTWGVICRGGSRAREYLERVTGVKEPEYLGVDTRSPKQQWKSGTIGVPVPDDWETSKQYMARWAKEDKENEEPGPEFHVGFSDTSITIFANLPQVKGWVEVVHWVSEEWMEDPTVTLSIANAINMIRTDPHKFLRVIKETRNDTI